MKLTRLRLVGFKTFVEPTDLLIEQGLTGIVGPNGCGKSNLVEALRWAMGESSHKAMRADDMDDVIFSGSTGAPGRPARNTAEVTLFLDNKTRAAPAQFNDQDMLEITRRIEREVGSHYRINHREVRARDVQILFADASTGSRSPALVHQGRIGEIVQAKPAQRRRVLEEAAGVAGLHARRHEAELRLNAADANLTRLEDVIAQIAGQIDALKRQARQAVRYRAVAAAIRKAEAQLCHLRFAAADAEVAEAEHAKDASVRRVAEATAAQAAAATAQANAAVELPGLREAEASAAAALQRLTLARDTLDREEARARERIAELDRRLIQLGEDIERERRLAADAEAALARLSDEEDALAREGAQGVEERIAVAERVTAAEAALAAAEKTFSELTVQHADLTARRNQFERAAREHAERRARAERQIAEVDAELANLEREGAGHGDVAVLAAASEAAQAAVAHAEAQALRAEAALSAARQGHDAAKGPADQAERRAHRLETEVRTLAKLLDVETQKLWPPAIDLVTVEKGFEAALGAALGDDLDAPIDPVAPVRWAGAAIDPADPALPDGAEKLSLHVTAPPELARRLAQVGVIDRADAARLSAELKPGQRLVSRDGDLWRWDGFAAAANAPTAAARRLAQKNRLADLEAELAPARAEAEGKRTSLEQAARAVADALAAESAARHSRREAQASADAARDRHAAAERAANRITGRLSALAEAKVRLASSLEEAAAMQREMSEALAALRPVAELESELSEVRHDVAAERAALAEIRGEAQALAREAELRERRLAAIAEEVSRWNERTAGARLQIETLDARLAETRRERAPLDAAPEAFAAKRGALIGEIEAAEAKRRAAADELAAKETALAGADRAARAALEATGAAREEAARAEERFESAKRHRIDIAHEIQELLEVEPQALAALAGIEPGAPLPDIDATAAELDKFKRDRERLGAVNLRAEEELREVEAQHGSLVAERDDLVEAIKRLRQGIQSLNREARERLTASFEVVNRHFQELFTSLFGGGSAELQLIESEDPLEAGLDILARPPGKKPQTLSLLSGGEQALTALALIFAVFLTNPAPICVLDEVDAPLDDHNVERFCDLLDEMTRKTDTRFVIITHNPITMARMNRLFGVTMAERGVSQLVSVDLDTAARIREAG
jgi:chromosome segregation protein